MPARALRMRMSPYFIFNCYCLLFLITAIVIHKLLKYKLYGFYSSFTM